MRNANQLSVSNKTNNCFLFVRRNSELVLMFTLQPTVDGLIPLPMKMWMRMVGLEISWMVMVVVLVQYLG